VHVGDPVLEIHYRDRTHLDGALALAGRAIAIGDARPAAMPLILGEVH
jgi:thymidine phosphorylase